MLLNFKLFSQRSYRRENNILPRVQAMICNYFYRYRSDLKIFEIRFVKFYYSRITKSYVVPIACVRASTAQARVIARETIPYPICQMDAHTGDVFVHSRSDMRTRFTCRSRSGDKIGEATQASTESLSDAQHTWKRSCEHFCSFSSRHNPIAAQHAYHRGLGGLCCPLLRKPRRRMRSHRVSQEKHFRRRNAGFMGHLFFFFPLARDFEPTGMIDT